MAISVTLDLSQAVSVHDLRHFLSYLPEGFEVPDDLRTSLDEGGVTHFLEIPLPVPGKQG